MYTHHGMKHLHNANEAQQSDGSDGVENDQRKADEDAHQAVYLTHVFWHGGASFWRWNGWREVTLKFNYSSPVPAPAALCGRRADLLDVFGRVVLAAGLEQLGNIHLVEALLPAAEFAADFHLALVAQNVIHFVLAQALQQDRKSVV